MLGEFVLVDWRIALRVMRLRSLRRDLGWTSMALARAANLFARRPGDYLSAIFWNASIALSAGWSRQCSMKSSVSWPNLAD